MKISLIVTVFNEEETIEALLDGIESQTRLPDEVIIVDAFSDDQTWCLLQQRKDFLKLKCRLLQKKGNRSAGRNFAIQQATHQVVAITDAGCVPEPEWIAALEQKAIEHNLQPDADWAVAGYYRALAKTNFQAAAAPYFLVMPDWVDPDHFLPATRSMMITKSLWQRVGRFNEQLSLNEDYPFARKIAQLQTKTKKRLLFFTAQAVVAWMPPRTVDTFAKTIYNFARGDAQSGSWRWKVASIYLRYLMLVAAAYVWSPASFMLTLFYLFWSIKKNIQHVSAGWYWLPALQVVSDMAVMWGTTRGLLVRTFSK